jgi:outer membrane lipoprotein-sorting protein
MTSINRTTGRYLAATLVIGALGLGLALPAAAGDLPAAEKLIEKYTQAIGGDTLTGVKNMSSTFKFEMPSQGVYSTGVEYWKGPENHYFRIDLADSGVPDYEAGITGDVAWEIHPMNGTRTVKGQEKKQWLRRAHLNPHAEWKSFFDKAETVAEETVREKACYKVVFTPAEGLSMNTYFDKETGLLVREELVGETGVRSTTDYGDWEEAQGILSPRTLRIQGTPSYTLKTTSVSYDVEDIPEDAFEVPASLKATAP